MRFFVVTVLIVLLIIGGVFGTIWALGKKPEQVIPVAVPAPAPAPKPQPTTKPAEKVLGPNEVRLLVAARPISSYNAVRLEDISVNGNLKWVDVDRSKIRPGAVPFEGTLDKFAASLGRVAKRDIPPESPLFEADFFEKGTRAGVVAAIPAGKRAMIIDASRLPGVHNLRPGDRIDLVAAITVDMRDVYRVLWSGYNRNNSANAYNGLGRNQMVQPITPGVVTGTSAVPQAWENPEVIASPLREAEFRILVDNGTLVTAAKRGTPGAPLAPDRSGGSLLNNKPGMSGSLDGLTGPPGAPPKPNAANPAAAVDEVMIVMHADEVPALTQALAIGAQIVVIPRSGSAETEEQAKTIPIKAKPVAEKKEVDDRYIIEQVIGKEKSTYVYPGKGEGKGD